MIEFMDGRNYFVSLKTPPVAAMGRSLKGKGIFSLPSYNLNTIRPAGTSWIVISNCSTSTKGKSVRTFLLERVVQIIKILSTYKYV